MNKVEQVKTVYAELERIKTGLRDLMQQNNLTTAYATKISFTIDEVQVLIKRELADAILEQDKVGPRSA